MARGLDLCSFTDVANGLVRDLERAQLEIWWQGGLRKRYLNGSLNVGSEVKIFACQVNTHRRAVLAPNDPNHQVNKMTHSVCVNGLINKAAMTAWMEILHGPSNMDFYSPRPVWLQSLLNTQPTYHSRNQHRAPNMTPLFVETSQTPDGRSITLEHFHFGSTFFFSHWGRWIFWMWVCLPCPQCFCPYHHP